MTESSEVIPITLSDPILMQGASLARLHGISLNEFIVDALADKIKLGVVLNDSGTDGLPLYGFDS